MNIYLEPHDLSNMRQVLNISTLASHRDKVDIDFLGPKRTFNV